MRHRSRQRGISFLGLLLLAVVVGFGVLIGLKLFPVYLESYKIDKAMTGVLSDPGTVKAGKAEILHSLFRRLDIDDVQAVNEGNWKDHVTLTLKNGRAEMEIQYRKETPLFGNLSIVATFDKTATN